MKGIRTVHLRPNRVTNGLCGVGIGFSVLVLLAGVYDGASASPVEGFVICAAAIILGLVLARRLGPGRLLSLEVTGADVRYVNAFEPRREFARTRGLRAVVWVTRGYLGAAPRLRGLYLVEADGTVKLWTRPWTFNRDRLDRFFAAVQIPVEVVDAVAAPFPVVRTGADEPGSAPHRA